VERYEEGEGRNRQTAANRHVTIVNPICDSAKHEDSKRDAQPHGDSVKFLHLRSAGVFA
jgi:hypothetical protein